jgi:2-methylisocitrate lyase-like PEP mutase family enzyme
VSEAFLALHVPGRPLLMPNAWDIGSAKVLASLGFEALATTSSGHAATLGRLDGSVTRDQAIAHARELALATGLPVSADLENCFADDPEGAAETVRLARDAGLAGCSIEDWSEDQYELSVAAARVEAAAGAAHAGSEPFVLTARAENYIRGNPDLADTIARLKAYEHAGADVLYAPGLPGGEEIGQVVQALSKPVNVLVRPGSPSIPELAELGVARISVGGGLAFAALGELVQAATELRDHGTYNYGERLKAGAQAARRAFIDG